MYGALRRAFFESYTICPLRSYCQYPPLHIWVSRGPETYAAEPALLGHPVKSGEGCHCCPVTEWCPTLHDPMDCSTPGFPVPHRLPGFVQVHAHWVGDAVPPSHPLSPSSPAFNLSQHQGLFWWVSSSHQMARVLEFQLQHESFHWIFRIDFF